MDAESSLPQAEGLTFEMTSATTVAVRFGSPPRASFLTLVRWLPPTWELRFYDQYYPSLSDPGGYVSVQRNGEAFAYMVGNHGWSTDWLKQSPELIAAWLHLNLDPLGPYSPRFDRIEIVKTGGTL